MPRFLLVGLVLLAAASPLRSQAAEHPRARGVQAPTVDLRWYKDVQRRPGQDSSLALAVAISGGGHRAGNFAVGVLLGLEKLGHGAGSNLLNEVDYFSTVSGGGLAAAAYLSERHAHRAGYAPSDTFFARALREFCPDGASRESEGVKERCLLFNLRRSYYRGFFRMFNPRDWGRRNFGDYLQAQLDRRLLGQRKHPELFGPARTELRLDDVFVPRDAAGEPALPYWFANATVQANGAIFPFSPDILHAYDLTQYRDDFRYQGLQGWGSLPLAVGLKSSASFPVAIHASVLGSPQDTPDRYVRLMDGGVADNLGVVTAAEVLCPSYDYHSGGRRVLLVVDVFPGDATPYEQSYRATRGSALLRLPFIGLDSWHARHRDYLRRASLGSACGFKLVFLSFDELVDHAYAADAPPAPADLERCARVLGVERFTLPDAGALEALRDQVAATGTNLNMSEEHQRLLVEAGRMVVCLNLPRIYQAISPGHKSRRQAPSAVAAAAPGP